MEKDDILNQYLAAFHSRPTIYIYYNIVEKMKDAFLCIVI